MAEHGHQRRDRPRVTVPRDRPQRAAVEVTQVGGRAGMGMPVAQVGMVAAGGLVAPGDLQLLIPPIGPEAARGMVGGGSRADHLGDHHLLAGCHPVAEEHATRLEWEGTIRLDAQRREDRCRDPGEPYHPAHAAHSG